MSTRSLLTLLLLAGMILVTTDAGAGRGRGGGNQWSQYEAQVQRDGLMDRSSSPAIVLLDRDKATFDQRKDDVWLDVEREFVLLARDPAALGDYLTRTFESRPGHEIRELTALRLRDGETKDADVEKSRPYEGCESLSDHETWMVRYPDVEAGDLLILEVKCRITGVNPTYTHTFDRPFPVLQSDVTFEVPKRLMGGQAGLGFNWWAGSHAGRIPAEDWSREKTYVFRWGEADIPAMESDTTPRTVSTAWCFDPVAARRFDMVEAEGLARGHDGNPAYHGPTLGAHQLSGRAAPARHEGRRDEVEERPSEASFGLLGWALVGEQVGFQAVHPKLEASRGLAKEARAMVADLDETVAIVEHLARAVTDQVEATPRPMDVSLADLADPARTWKQKCGSEADRVILLGSMLRAAGVNAFPVLLEAGYISGSQCTVASFDSIALMVSTGNGSDLLVDPVTGMLRRGLRDGAWTAVLTLPLDRAPELLLGDELAALIAN